MNELIQNGTKYPTIKLKDYLILNENKIKPSKIPEQTFITLGVSNEIGIFRNEDMVASETNQAYFLVEKNQFCYNPYRINVGSIGLNTFDYLNQIISGAYLVFGCKEDELNPKYLNALFNNQRFLDYVIDKAAGGVRMNFKFEDMEDWEIPLPNIDEQVEIVNQIEKQKAIIKGADLILKNWEIDFNGFTVNQSIVRKPIADLILDSLYGTSEKSDYQEDGYNILRIGNIGFCGFKLHDIKKSNLSKKDFEKYKLEKGDFLIVRSNGNPNLVGKCAVWNEDISFAYASYLIRFRFDTSEVLPEFVMYYLMSPEGRNALNPQAGGGTYNISATHFKKVVIPLLDIDVQKRVVTSLNSSLDQLKNLEIMKEHALKKIHTLISSIWSM